ncbi:MAG TPA: hypothetical protein VKF14_07765 [Candidatus Dormibacteraeota bacterium]|nr:hypothetical protein [Candidatus Dormibacteraeota bacterium]
MDVRTLLVNERGVYTRFGIDALMDRLESRVGFHVHAHGFRHTFATVLTKLGWNFEHLRGYGPRRLLGCFSETSFGAD